VVDLLKARGGQVKGGQRALAKQLKLSKSRVNELLREAADTGLVRLSTSRSGTSVAIAAA
jgi:DNA-binding transcriptional regulator LsrR (DeoR family)